MMTREEFDERLLKFAREWHGDIWAAMPGSKADGLRSPAIRAALLAAFDAQAARIEELEDERRIRITNLQAIESHANWQAARIAQLEREVHLVRERNAELAAQRLEADDRAYYEGRIAELEAAMECACDFLDALQKDTGVGDGTAFMLRAVLGRETKHGDDTDAG